jgi:hypothetical protein
MASMISKMLIGEIMKKIDENEKKFYVECTVERIRRDSRLQQNYCLGAGR